jgi:hypothetical protein
MKPTDVRILPHFASRNPIQIIRQTEDKNKVIIAVKKSQQSFGSAFGITEENVLICTKKLKIANYCTAFQGLLVTINTAFDYILKNNRYNETTVIVKSDKSNKKLKFNTSYNFTNICQSFENTRDGKSSQCNAIRRHIS